MIALVLTIVMLVTCHSSEAQLFRRLHEENSAATDIRQSNAKADSRKVQDPRTAQANSNSVPGQGRSPQDSRQQSPIPKGNQNRYPSGLTGKSTNPIAAQPQRSQPTPSPRPQPARPLSTNPQAQAATQKQPQQPRPPQASVNTNSSRSNRENPRPPAGSRLDTLAAPAEPFKASPLSQPKFVAEPARRALSDTEQSQQGSRDPLSANSRPSQLTEIAKPANEKEVLNRFGFVLKEDNEILSVLQIEPRGNAAQAGLERGDKIVSIGGAPVASPREFTEIAGLLSEGDQIELVISRDGKEEKAFIQYGKAIESAPGQTGNNSDLQLGDSNWSASAQSETEQLQQLVAQQRQVIAELQKRIRELENSQGRSGF